MHHRRITVAAISAIGVALACSQDRITSSDTAATQGGVVPLVTIGEPPAIQAFDIDVSFQGSLKPGAPIVITVRAQANVDAPDAEIVVATPELETVKLRAAQGGPFPLSTPLPLQAGFKGGVVVGQVVARSFTVTAPLAGYYSVQIEAKVRGVPPRAGRPVEDVVRAERWMLIDERGGANNGSV